jgi:hypothetical protein
MADGARTSVLPGSDADYRAVSRRSLEASAKRSRDAPGDRASPRGANLSTPRWTSSRAGRRAGGSTLYVYHPHCVSSSLSIARSRSAVLRGYTESYRFVSLPRSRAAGRALSARTRAMVTVASALSDVEMDRQRDAV